ncbi:S-layer homology domain-containing protein [candidate division WOR-3 bacterium]|nr:S-layer homology domain-containing protein [candidate division WOR-3 bacterium]
MRKSFILAVFIFSCSTAEEIKSVKTIRFLPVIVRTSNQDAFLLQVEALSRGELAYILDTRMSSRGILVLFPIKNSGEPRDISGHWAEKSISRVSERSILSSFPDGCFYPDDPVKNFQLAIIFFRIFNEIAFPGYSGDIYMDSWDWALENGFVSGGRNDYVSGAEALERVKLFCEYLGN